MVVVIAVVDVILALVKTIVYILYKLLKSEILYTYGKTPSTPKFVK